MIEFRILADGRPALVVDNVEHVLSPDVLEDLIGQSVDVARDLGRSDLQLAHRLADEGCEDCGGTGRRQTERPRMPPVRRLCDCAHAAKVRAQHDETLRRLVSGQKMVRELLAWSGQ
jgi:hypothetical protein